MIGVGRWVKPLEINDFQGQQVNLPESKLGYDEIFDEMMFIDYEDNGIWS